ncbi:putative phage terminase large subunit-like protein [Pseudaminobacter salicylatoxidans]|uniref:Putative phage terminase large subunit-like protein n=1 Tax=Pseudaminobacter salicylatoxidans TaxID=93369 RepID=A0A316BZV3_PSESE|nr:phage terminase large subunit [Pseudaminobacter salicylatoxidans]PWJ80630.1 putative phage terminase large subunit-like protein [Pseudaminobacter salicylatoxidans]
MMRLIRAEKARRAAEAERERVSRDAERIRARCQSLEGFIVEFWDVLEPKKELKFGWALRAMCRHLEAVTEGQIQFLMMTVPPGMMKSLVLVFWTAWEWGPCARPDIQVLATSYSQPNVLRDNIKLRRLVESDKFQALWPLRLRDDQNAKGKFENTGSGFSEARPFSSMTGGRGDRVKIDDPHSTETAESDTERQAAVRIFREGISDRLNDVTTSAIVIIMQRLHEQDVAAVALELDIGFVHLNLPMEFDPERACRTYVRGELFFEDPRTEDGELLFPERFPPAEIERLKKAKGSYAYSGQYQQRPTPRSGGMFQRGDFEIVDAIPAGAERCRAWDFAATQPKPGRQPDWTVGLRMARVDGIFYVEDVTRDRWSPADVERNLKNTASQDGLAVRIRMPQDPGAAGKADAATKIKLLAGYDVKALPVTGDKATRAKPASAQAEAGNVKLVRAKWNEAFLDEVCSFPNAQFDDQVDAFADALNELALGSTFTLDNV